MDDPFLAKMARDGLPGDDLALLGQACRGTVEVRAQSDIVSAGGGARQLHVLLKGWACKYRLMADGRRQLFRVLLPGDVCDLDGLYGAAACADVLALSDCRAAVIPLDSMRGLIDERPGLRELVWSLAAAEGAALGDQLVSLGRRSARERTAHLLCELLDRLQGLGEAMDDSFRLPLTQVDLGDYLGLSTVHINRTLQELRNERLIQHSGRTFTVCDRDRLERLAGYGAGGRDTGRARQPGERWRGSRAG